MTLVWYPENERPLAPATFKGIQKGYGYMPDVRLFNLTADIPGHPVGSTVSEQTLIAAGFRIWEDAR